MGSTSGHSSAAGVKAQGLRWAIVGFILAIIALVLDQGVKFWVDASMLLGQSIEVIPNVLYIHYIKNPGAAFSMGESMTLVFTLLQAAVSVFVIYLLLRKVKVRIWALSLGALLGGVLGNLGDRLFREPSFGFGHVVDMISVEHFAIFNVADSFICCSMVMIAYLMLRGVNLDGSIGDKKPVNDGPTEDKAKS